MAEEVPPGVRVIEAHEEFKQQIEAGASRVRWLGLITMGVAFVLIAAYFSQLLTPYASATRYVQVDLRDPTLVAVQIVLILLAAAWLYVGAVNYTFARKMQKTVREIRAQEKRFENRIFG